MSEIERLMAETDRRLLIPGDALTAERVEWLRVEKSLRAQLAVSVDGEWKLRAEVDGLRKEIARLRAALGDDDAGRPFAELLHTAATCFSDGGGGPLGDCLRSKAYAVEAALETP